MKKFNFNYSNDSVKKISCWYSCDGIIDQYTYWEGHILTNNIDGKLRIEGYEKDNADPVKYDGTPYVRYILGENAISEADGTLKFVIYPGQIAPILYELKYNSDEKCFNGTWRFIKTDKHKYLTESNGEAIIRINDCDLDKTTVSSLLSFIVPVVEDEYEDDMEMVNRVLDISEKEIAEPKTLKL